MLHGKKGFGRLEWAAKNVLNASLTWLFYNSNPGSRESLPEGRETISVHHPFVKTVTPSVARLQDTLAPRLRVKSLPDVYEQENSLALLEWLHLVSLESPRLRASDDIDPFLSRYEVPDLGSGLEKKSMVRLRWRGFISPEFSRELFLVVRKEGLKIEKGDHDGEGGTINVDERRWFALSAKGFGAETEEWYTVMQWAGRETLCWENV
jgi:ribonuclease P/MRP protein subunit RPP40